MEKPRRETEKGRPLGSTLGPCVSSQRSSSTSSWNADLPEGILVTDDDVPR